ncbi:hypothetical protein MUK42_37743 [Musa troglodytarum]|uniref:Uncharacterized protein n=1 Tax=Musa troglodytarum TaxID=320322 RepID=A0A9E7G266_9LILI|nr:hypothetical protein MUK42_37743 [Musa troglodytarum]
MAMAPELREQHPRSNQKALKPVSSAVKRKELWRVGGGTAQQSYTASNAKLSSQRCVILVTVETAKS